MTLSHKGGSLGLTYEAARLGWRAGHEFPCFIDCAVRRVWAANCDDDVRVHVYGGRRYLRGCLCRLPESELCGAVGRSCRVRERRSRARRLSKVSRRVAILATTWYP